MLISQVHSLPPMPDTVPQLRRLLADPRSDFGEIIPLLQKDPGLCADLIRMANSSLYGRSCLVDTLQDAVLTLGVVNLANITAIQYSRKILQAVFSRLVNLGDYFNHSAQVSLLAYLLSRAASSNHHEHEVCRIGGLLHNIGRLVIVAVCEEWKAALGPILWEERQSSLDVEKSLFGVNHCEIGMMICQKWKFPESLVEGIARHHTPVENGNLCRIGAFIYLSELLVIDGLQTEWIVADFPEDSLASLGINLAKMEEVRAAYQQHALFKNRVKVKG